MKVLESALIPVSPDTVAGDWEIGEMAPVGCKYALTDTGALVIYWPTADLWDDEIGPYTSLTVTLPDGSVYASVEDCLGFVDGCLNSVNYLLERFGDEAFWVDTGI